MVLQQNFIDEVAPLLLGVYDCCGNLDSMGVTYRRGVISIISALSGTNYFRKWVGAPNEKQPNRDMQNYLKIGK